MKRTLLALFMALAACGDDAPSDDDPSSDEGSPPRDAAAGDAAADRMDARTDGASSAPEFLDASAPANPSAPADATAPGVDASVVDASSFDAQVADAGAADGSAADASAPDASECAAEGDRCGTSYGACCEGAACVTSSAAPYEVCAAVCSADSDCESGCCHALPGSGDAKVCAAQSYCDDESDPTAPLVGVNCVGQRPKVFGYNGTYLGEATANMLVNESVCKPAGPYGALNMNGALHITSDAYEFALPFSAVIKCKSTDLRPFAYVSRFTGMSATRVIHPNNLCTVLANSKL